MKNSYGDEIDYDSLNPHTYPDEGPEIFYDCPRCGGEYLRDFIFIYNGEVMCIDCWQEVSGVEI